MKKIRTKRLPEFYVVMTPRSHAILSRIMSESNRSPSELLKMAMDVFAYATGHINLMHQPPRTVKPLTKEKRDAVAPIGGTVKHVVRKLTKGKPS